MTGPLTEKIYLAHRVSYSIVHSKHKAAVDGFEHALDLIKNGDFKGAIKAFETVLSEDPSNVEAWVNLAQLKGKLGDHEGEAGALQEALVHCDGHPLESDIRNDLGVCYERMGDIEKALGAYKMAADRAPRDPVYLFNLASAMRTLGDLDGAISAYRRALALDPDYSEAWVNLGIALFESKDMSGARAAFKKAVALDPENAMAWYDLALTESQGGNEEQAIPCYRQALALDPDIALAWFNLGVALEKVKDFDGAKTAYENVLGLEPDDADARKALKALSKKKKTQKVSRPRKRAGRK